MIDTKKQKGDTFHPEYCYRLTQRLHKDKRAKNYFNRYSLSSWLNLTEFNVSITILGHDSREQSRNFREFSNVQNLYSFCNN